MTDPSAPVRILLLDDEEPVLNALRRVLRKEGYEITLCTDPDAALRIVREAQIDIVVSDFLMPGMTGTEFFALAARLHPHVVRIMLTGQADMEVAVQAINQGHVHRFLTKPWDDDQLKHVLREAARQIQVRHQAEGSAPLPSQTPVVDASALLAERPPALARDASGAIVIDTDDLPDANPVPEAEGVIMQVEDLS